MTDSIPSDEEPSVLGAGGGKAPMPTLEEARAVWRARYIARMVSKGVPEEGAEQCFDVVGWDDAFSQYSIDDNPEDMADDEMSYWENDGD